MIPPLLKLAFVKGPRDGESLEYKPGSTIRIGRIVRGNEIAIKDAGISTKHLRIVSDSDNWVIHDLGSSNGTKLNSEDLDPDTPVNLHHGDVIKVGEDTSIVVNFETNAQAQEHKLPPRPRRNTRRLADLPIESVQEKPTRKGRSSKQDEDELPKRTRATTSKTAEDVADNEKEPEVNSRVSRSRKKGKEEAITKEEEVAEEEKGNSRARGGKKVQNLIKLEMEDTPKGVEMEISGMKRATRSRQPCLGVEEKGKSEDTTSVLEEKRPSRATRSRKKEIGGDSFLELDMVLNQARKTRASKKKMEHKASSSILEMEARNDDVEEDPENENDDEAQKEGETSKAAEQMEIELRKKSTLGEEDLNCSAREDGGATANLQATFDDESDCRGGEPDGGCDEEKAEQESSSKKNVEKAEVDLGQQTLAEWFEFMEVQLRKQIVEETEKMIEPMRSKSLRVHKHIAEQKQAKGKAQRECELI